MTGQRQELNVVIDINVYAKTQQNVPNAQKTSQSRLPIILLRMQNHIKQIQNNHDVLTQQIYSKI